MIPVTQLIIVTVVIPSHGLQDNAIHPDHIGMPHAAEQGSLLDQLCNGGLTTCLASLPHAMSFVCVTATVPGLMRGNGLTCTLESVAGMPMTG